MTSHSYIKCSGDDDDGDDGDGDDEDYDYDEDDDDEDDVMMMVMMMMRMMMMMSSQQSIECPHYLQIPALISFVLSGTLAAGMNSDDYDDMYEVPDRDMSKVKLKTNTKSPVSKHPQVLPPSPALLHREVPKPPKEAAVVVDDIDGESDGTYDTISCSVHLGGEDLSGKKHPAEASSGLSDIDSPSTEPEYAVVDKRREKNVVEDEGVENSPSRKENQNSPDGNKFQVLIRRTTISLGDKGQSHARETKTVEVIETPAPQVPHSNEIDIQPHDSVPTPAALDDLYAKVNLEEKHLEESKRALYATVDKPKTGVVRMYSSDASTDNREEFEGDHYTRIKGLLRF